MVGFSQRGPRYAARGSDDLIQAACGQPPRSLATRASSHKHLPTIADRTVGIYVWRHLRGRLCPRAQSGRRQRVDIPMFETMIAADILIDLHGHAFVHPGGLQLRAA